MDVGPRTLAAGLVILSASLAGCASAPEGAQVGACEDTWTPYEDPDGRFALCHPPDWITREDLMGTDVAVYPAAEMNDDFTSNANVVYREMADPRSSESVMQQQLPTLREMVTDFELVSQGPVDTNAYEAYAVTYEGTQGTYDLRWNQWAITHEDHLAIFTYTTERGEDPLDAGTLDRVLASITLSG